MTGGESVQLELEEFSGSGVSSSNAKLPSPTKPQQPANGNVQQPLLEAVDSDVESDIENGGAGSESLAREVPNEASVANTAAQVFFSLHDVRVWNGGSWPSARSFPALPCFFRNTRVVYSRACPAWSERKP
eukprot:scpid36675/ scgid3189/ 